MIIYSISMYLSKRNRNMCSYKVLLINVHGSFICNSHNLETTQNIHQVNEKNILVYNGILFSNKKEQPVNVTT